MNHPIFGSRIWKLDSKITTPDGTRYMRFIEDRPDLLQDLKQISDWYVKSGRFMCSESSLVNKAIQNLESGLLVDDKSIALIEKLALSGAPIDIDPEMGTLIYEMLELSENPDLDLESALSLRKMAIQLSSFGLSSSKNDKDLDLKICCENALEKAKQSTEINKWIPDSSETNTLRLIGRLLQSTPGKKHQSDVYDFAKAKHYLWSWLKNNESFPVASFPRMYYEILNTCFSKELAELKQPSFRPSDLVQRKKKSWWLAKGRIKDSTLLILSGPSVIELGNKNVVYTCFESGFGETTLSFDEIKKVKLAFK